MATEGERNTASLGGHPKEKAGLLIKWVNQSLSAGGYADVVTDLSADMADGITLLKLVQSLTKERLPRHSPRPMMRAKRLENLQMCITFLLEKLHVDIEGAQAEDVLAGDLGCILDVCHCLRRHFSATAGSASRSANPPRPLVHAIVEKEDMEVFTWVGKLIGKDISSYSIFYDGHILCELVNMVHEGAISDKELSRSLESVARLQLVDAASREHLFMSPALDPVQVDSGKQDGQIRLFLQHCKKIYQQRTGKLRGRTSLTRSSSDKKERLFVIGGGREAKEAAHITARSYDAIHSKKTDSHDQLQTSASKKLPSDLYVQGASSFTDLSSRRLEHENMLRGASRGISKQSSTSSESLDQGLYAPFMGGLDRVQSMESGISAQERNIDQSATLARSVSQGNLPPAVYPSSHLPPRPNLSKSLARSTESFHTQTFGLSSARRTPSYVQLNSTSEDWAEKLNALESRVGVLASRFLYERQDMFKQILRALVKERKKRQLAEHRIEALEKSSIQLVQHYDSKFIELAKQVAVLRSEVNIQGGGSANMVTMEIKQLQEQLTNLAVPPNQEQALQYHQLSSTADTFFLRKRKGTEVSRPTEANSYCKGSAISYKKLSKFFGEDPPRLENIESLLAQLGYTDYLPKFRAHNISLVELRTLNEKHLEAIGIPLGVRVRLLEEAMELEPVTPVS